jgi:PTS system nitrogen regulatory IIA component
MDFKKEDVIQLLNITEETLLNWIENYNFPVYRVEDQLRFSAMSIEHWLLGKSHQESGDELRGDHSLSIGYHKYALYRAFSNGFIEREYEPITKNAAITKMSKLIAKKLDLDPEILNELLIDREQLASTGIGNGFALPHTRERLEGIESAIFVLLLNHPIEYESVDGQEVFCLFFFFAPEDKLHLRLLSKLAYFLSNDVHREFLSHLPEQRALLDQIRTWEGGLIR